MADAHLVDARRGAALRPGDVFVANDVATTRVAGLEVEHAAAIDHGTAVEDFGAGGVGHVQVEVGIGVPGEGDFDVAEATGRPAPSWRRMTVKQSAGPVAPLASIADTAMQARSRAGSKLNGTCPTSRYEKAGRGKSIS